MKHALRKYLSPCGSALFMVVSTMAALIVLVTAMYMSVLSSRQVQYATFDQEQAYVTSTSISDIIGSYIADKKTSELTTRITELKEGESLSTNGNGFSAFTGIDTDSDDTVLGAYTVDITRLKDEELSGTQYMVFDIAVTVSQNEIVETTHTYMRVKKGEKPPMPGLDRCFTATGYVPNDVLLQSVIINTTAYYDSEYVKFSDQIELGYGEKPNTVTIKGGLICAGTVVFDQPNQALSVKVSEPTEWYIGNNMNVTDGNPFPCDLGGNGTEFDQRGRLVVGQDLDITAKSSFGGEGPTDVYVLGDLKISGAKANYTHFYGNVYVRGNVTIDAITSFHGNLYVGGNVDIRTNTTVEGEIFVTAGSTITAAANQYNSSLICVNMNGKDLSSTDQIKSNIWNMDASDDSSMTLNTAADNLSTAIGSSIYPKWIVDTKKSDANVKNIIFNGGWEDVNLSSVYVTGVSDTSNQTVMSYYKGISSQIVPGNTRTYYIDEDCTIGDIIDVGVDITKADVDWTGKRGGGAHAIIIDTGSAGEVRTINLQPNIRFDSSKKCNGFVWAVAYREGEFVNPNTEDRIDWSTYGQAMSIITVGDGKLVINIPEETTYQMSHNEFVGHYAWFMYNGGTYNADRDEYKMSSANPERIRAAIHNADKCNGSCTYVKAQDKDGNEVYTCEIHGGSIETEPEKGTCACTGRIDKGNFTDSKYFYNGATKSSGKMQKPNVNIFLVSCDESADIQIGCFKYRTGKAKSLVCEYYGYVYAPYMTYMDMTDAGSSGMKVCGGLIVSDYVMSGYHEYIFAYPDETLEDIIGDDFEPIESNANRDWRVYGT